MHWICFSPLSQNVLHRSGRGAGGEALVDREVITLPV